ncbi:MAG: shikimate kinase [Thermodesulfovibrionales bacterium]
MKNVVIIGFMGTGKTTVGKMLAQRLGFNFLDLDKEIERSQGILIREIFEIYGEERFREIETETIRSFKDKSNMVISAGGGVVTREENIKMLRENGIIVSLTAEPEVIFERVKHNKDRPLLLTSNPFETIKTLLKSRRELYKNADIEINTSNLSPLQVVQEIVDGLDKRRK